jgi:hypothetical protein
MVLTPSLPREGSWSSEPWSTCMMGRVIWYHPELRFGFIECSAGMTLGSVTRGCLDLFHEVKGPLAVTGPATLTNVSTGREVLFDVEANALSEDQVNELLGLVQG